MNDEAVLSSIRALVAAGEYLDQLPGVPGARLTGGGVFEGDRRLYARGSPEHLDARAKGLVERLPALVPAPLDAVEDAEARVQLPLPRLLRTLYLEVGNGGFGPGYGILGVRAGHGDDDGKTAIDLYREAHSEVPSSWNQLPRSLLPVCYWGCGIYSFVDCSDPATAIWAWDPNPVPHAEIGKALFRTEFTLALWLGRWCRAQLLQPAVIEDPQTGEWRGASHAELEAMSAD